MATVTLARTESNKWIRKHAHGITGKVLSLGSGSDLDNEGGKYRDYFFNAESYSTSDISSTAPAQYVLDVRDMSTVVCGYYDCIFAAGLLEHVDDMFRAMREINRIMKTGGVILTGMPFGYRIHRAPQDYWRATIHGMRYLLEGFGFEVVEMITVPGVYKDFPAAYWVRGTKIEEAR